MNDGEIISSLRQICREQGEEIEKKKLQIEDVEEENRLLRIRIRDLEAAVDEQVKQKEELQCWCGHLQSIIDSNAERQAAQESRIGELQDWCAHLQQIVDESGKLQDWCSHLQSIVDEDARQLKARETRIGELQDWCTHLQSIVDEDAQLRKVRESRIEELQNWCSHLQSIVDEDARQREEREQKYRRLEQRYGVFFRLARRFIQHL